MADQARMLLVVLAAWATAGSCSAAVDHHPEVLFCQAAFQLLFPKSGVLYGVFVTQVQDPALSLVKLHTIYLDPLIQSFQTPLQSLAALKQINSSPA